MASLGKSPINFEGALAGQTVLVTGHTGFTGGWLCAWLAELNCKIIGVGLQPATNPNLFSAASIGACLESRICDIRDYQAFFAIVTETRPVLIFHLAAQPLVSRAYEDPLESFSINAIGTANVLEAARSVETVRGVISITTDKVYADQDWIWGYRENDRLGGKDPYSASKACAELIADCYRKTMSARGNGFGLAVARGGNIIGGGDWSNDRIIPDFYRSLSSSVPLVLRNADAVRPWQHVLALVHGYLVLGSGLLQGYKQCNDDFNFGPLEGEVKSVRELVEALSTAWRRPRIQYGQPTFIETRFLQVDSTKARRVLGWQPPVGFQDTVNMTAHWYEGYMENAAMASKITLDQIAAYREMLLTKV